MPRVSSGSCFLEVCVPKVFHYKRKLTFMGMHYLICSSQDAAVVSPIFISQNGRTGMKTNPGPSLAQVQVYSNISG